MMMTVFKELTSCVIGFAAAGALLGAVGQAFGNGIYKESDLILGFIVPPAVKIFYVSVLFGTVIGGYRAILELWGAMSEK